VPGRGGDGIAGRAVVFSGVTVGFACSRCRAAVPFLRSAASRRAHPADLGRGRDHDAAVLLATVGRG